MKAKDLASAIQAYGKMLDGFGVHQAGLVSELAAVFALSTKTVASELKRLELIELAPGASGPTLREAGTALTASLPYLKIVAKTPVLADFRAVVAFLVARPSVGLPALRAAMTAPPKKTRSRAVAAVREDVVVQRHQLLEAALGDEARFARAFAEVKADLTGAEIIALAKSFMGTSARSKAEALRKIEARQQYLLGSLARAAATAGRTAA